MMYSRYSIRMASRPSRCSFDRGGDSVGIRLLRAAHEIGADCLVMGAAHMDVAKIPIGREPPNDINVIVEIAQGGNPVKYELDKESGAVLRRPLSAHRDVLSG
jgi:hypothetical protein